MLITKINCKDPGENFLVRTSGNTILSSIRMILKFLIKVKEFLNNPMISVNRINICVVDVPCT